MRLLRINIIPHTNHAVLTSISEAAINITAHTNHAVLTSISEAAMDDHILSIVSEVLFDKTVVNESYVGRHCSSGSKLTDSCEKSVATFCCFNWQLLDS